MKRNSTKVIVAIVLAITLLTSLSVTVYAYSLNPYRHKNSKIYYYYDNWVGSRAISFFNWSQLLEIKNYWSTNTALFSNPGTGYNVYMSAGNISGVGWDGLTQTSYQSGYVVSQTVTLNMSKTSTWNNDGALKSVVVHEMGHVFGLKDNGTTKTIMNGYTFGTNSRYGGYRLTVPQTDDVNGVNAKY